MTEEKMREYARKLEEFKPKFIRGYPSALFILAKYLHENDYNDIKTESSFHNRRDFATLSAKGH